MTQQLSNIFPINPKAKAARLLGRVTLESGESMTIDTYLQKLQGHGDIALSTPVHRSLYGVSVYHQLVKQRAKLSRKWSGYDFSFFRVASMGDIHCKVSRSTPGVVRCCKHNCLFDATPKELDRRSTGHLCPLCIDAYLCKREYVARKRATASRKRHLLKVAARDPVRAAKEKKKRQTRVNKARRQSMAKAGIAQWHLPHTLYYVALEKEGVAPVYKIGTTGLTVDIRFHGMVNKGVIVRKVWAVEFVNKADARDAEEELIEAFKKFRYKGYSPLRTTGTTEMFCEDVIPWSVAKDHPALGEEV